MSEPPLQPTPSPTTNISIYTKIGGITEAQIADTIAPPFKGTVNISEEFISIARYFDLATLGRLMVSKFRIDYLIQGLQKSDVTEVLEVIRAENFADDFLVELAYELKIPRENLTIENLTIKIGQADPMRASYDPWTEIALVLAIFLLFMLLVGIVGFVVRQHAKKEQDKFEEMKSSGEIITDRTVRNEGLRARKRRGVRISCCSCFSEESKKSLCPCCIKEKRKKYRTAWPLV
eukprot:TRINITY_DN419_c0_g2_i2.p1 TRINITY_DN419_c0_g2~~TRINITY_DN419_c0_g2_i2.p1  ORF type:complete len:234 (-),score=26.09 TRINITY_DN419_c0_g2_i2:27-728(-)